MRMPSVDRARQTEAARGKARTRTIDGGLFVSHLAAAADDGIDTAAPEAALAALATPGIDALLALQAVDPDAEGKARAAVIEYAHGLLDELEGLRLDLLAGAIPAERLGRLQRLLSSDRQRLGDDKLDALVAEIELRVEIEIAKRASDV